MKANVRSPMNGCGCRPLNGRKFNSSALDRSFVAFVSQVICPICKNFVSPAVTWEMRCRSDYMRVIKAFIINGFQTQSSHPVSNPAIRSASSHFAVKNTIGVFLSSGSAARMRHTRIRLRSGIMIWSTTRSGWYERAVPTLDSVRAQSPLDSPWP